MKTKLTIYLILCTLYFSQAQNKEQPILITGATIHIGNGEVIEKGIIVLENGVITQIGKYGETVIDRRAHTTIDGLGKHVYPGFINVNNTLGLREIDAVRATRDYQEAGALNPHVRAMIAFNTDSKVAKTVRTNGVLITQATPRGGRISGQSAVMKLDGWNWEDATISESDGIHLNWPASFKYKWNGHGVDLVKNDKKDEQITELQQFITNAKAYGLKHDVMDMRLEAMQSILEGKSNLYIHVNSAKGIIASVNFAKENKIKKIVIVEGGESFMVTDFLKENNIPVILSRVHDLPMKEDDSVLSSYELANKLEKAGVKYCLGWSGDMEAMNSRNLQFGAGTTVAYGVDYEKAVTSISLNTAQILGIDKMYGSLEKGKSATLFISDGDALDMRTNNVIYAFIDGIKVDLNNHQKELSDKYLEKYNLESKK